MAQVVVRGLEEEVKEGLKRRARRHGRSMEDEVRHILRKAAREAPAASRKLGSRIAARFKGRGLSSDVPEWRGHRPKPADFEL
jgi:plasmid stability protein